MGASKAIRKTERELNHLWCAQFAAPSQHYACIESVRITNDDNDDDLTIEVVLRWGCLSDDGKVEYQYRRSIFVEPHFFTPMYLCGYMQAIEDEGVEHYERNGE